MSLFSPQYGHNPILNAYNAYLFIGLKKWVFYLEITIMLIVQANARDFKMRSPINIDSAAGGPSILIISPNDTGNQKWDKDTRGFLRVIGRGVLIACSFGFPQGGVLFFYPQSAITYPLII
jgi:hypothetical protein